MAEKEIEKLAATTGHQTFKVFAEWMRDNRVSVEKHLASQDRKLETIRTEVGGKLDEIHAEVRITNGRVTDLEQTAKLAAALKEGKESVEADLTVKQEKQLERGQTKRLALWGSGITAAATIIGGLIGYLLHVAGAW